MHRCGVSRRTLAACGRSLPPRRHALFGTRGPSSVDLGSRTRRGLGWGLAAAAAAAAALRPGGPAAAESTLDREAVDRYIGEVLARHELYATEGVSTIHLPLVLQQHLFRALIHVALDLIHDQLHGLAEPVPLLGHEIRASITASPALLRHVDLAPSDVQLERIVDERFLPNQRVNMWWLPDSLERGFYISCLRVLKTVLIDVLATLRITIMGQTLSLLPMPEATAAQWPPPMTARGRGIAPPLGMQIDEEALAAAVKETMSGPDWASRLEYAVAGQAYEQMFRIVLVFFEEVSATSELEFLGYSVHHHLVGPHPAVKATQVE
uniref:Uncharacterized protein n=1 Tax=Alexandrium monilatum TaxID=311494 RepID=A0A7S4QWR4_9DINO|mmetsp:Transcript_1028/g.3492  ORF Transcript_1028/g.3492 Transcript_1028/m.3492 type:complete len:323 (-) Transcript_1028:41-1009(-)